MTALERLIYAALSSAGGEVVPGNLSLGWLRVVVLWAILVPVMWVLVECTWLACNYDDGITLL